MKIIYHPIRGFAENVLTICSFYIPASFANQNLSFKKFVLDESNIKKISFEVKGKIFVKIILHFVDFIFHVEQIVKYTIAFPYIKYILDINHLFLNIFHKPRLRILILVKGFKSLEREKQGYCSHP